MILSYTLFIELYDNISKVHIYFIVHITARKYLMHMYFKQLNTYIALLKEFNTVLNFFNGTILYYIINNV